MGEEFRKFYIFGIGGAGGKILSAILQHREEIATATEVAIWDRGIAGWYILNTNTGDVLDTWIAKEEGWTRSGVINKNMIGWGTHNYTGSGMNWSDARNWMEMDVKKREGMERPRIWDLVDQREVGNAESVLIIHGIGQGTGCGASPVLAQFLKKQEEFPNKSIFTLTVLPRAEEIKGSKRHRENTIAGFTEMAKVADVIIVVSNAMVENRIHSEATDKIKCINFSIIEVIEFILAVTINILDRSVVCDLNNIKVLATDRCCEVNGRRVGIVVPFIGRTTIGDPYSLIINTFKGNRGKFAEIDLKTASGAMFILVGNRHLINGLRGNDGRILIDTAKREVFDNPEFVINIFDAKSDQFDEVYLLALVFNPKIRDLDEIWKKVRGGEIRNNEEAAIRDTAHELMNCLEVQK